MKDLHEGDQPIFTEEGRNGRSIERWRYLAASAPRGKIVVFNEGSPPQTLGFECVGF